MGNREGTPRLTTPQRHPRALGPKTNPREVSAAPRYLWPEGTETWSRDGLLSLSALEAGQNSGFPIKLHVE